MASEPTPRDASGWRTRLAARLLAREPAGRPGGRALPPAAHAALRRVVATLDRDQALGLLVDHPGPGPGEGADAPPRRLPEPVHAALARLAHDLPMDQAVGLIAGWTTGASLRAWLPVEPGVGASAQDPAVTELLAEAWVATTGYAGLLAALTAYLAVRPALDQAAFPTDARFLEGLRRASSTSRAVAPDVRAVQRVVTDAVLDDETLHLDGAALRFPDRNAAWIVLHELVVRRSYDFERVSGRRGPARILDGGAHLGLSVWACLRRFPDARITAFEPDPGNRAVLEENRDRNGWTGVEVLPFALAAEDGTATFSAAAGRSMAGTLTDRLGEGGDRAFEVQTRRLGPWLEEPVDFLKLDIEGPEDAVLADAAGPDRRGLDRVDHLFCEYHHGHGLDEARLHRLLATLDDAGFAVQVGRSFTAELGNAIAPLLHAGKPYALDVHAKRRGPSPETA